VRRPWAGAGGAGGQDCLSPADSYQACAQARDTLYHSSGWNYVYADGHVKWSRPEQTIGKGLSGTGKDAGGAACSNINPCGPWTMDPND
jgi:prepilin-type processing-associated H-X9-DG protein